jgi:thioredoxin reductase
MYDLIIIGAGPGGIALAAEACASGISQSQILVLEKGGTHNSAIRQLYPSQKLTTANYKGFDARCEGLLCVSDMTKSETKAFFDKRVTRISMEAPAIRSQLNLCRLALAWLCHSAQYQRQGRAVILSKTPWFIFLFD